MAESNTNSRFTFTAHLLRNSRPARIFRISVTENISQLAAPASYAFPSPAVDYPQYPAFTGYYSALPHWPNFHAALRDAIELLHENTKVAT